MNSPTSENKSEERILNCQDFFEIMPAGVESLIVTNLQKFIVDHGFLPIEKSDIRFEHKRWLPHSTCIRLCILKSANRGTENSQVDVFIMPQGIDYNESTKAFTIAKCFIKKPAKQ